MVVSLQILCSMFLWIKTESSPKLMCRVVIYSKESGNGSGGRKKGLVLGLVRACREKETKYIVRTLVSLRRHASCCIIQILMARFVCY